LDDKDQADTALGSRWLYECPMERIADHLEDVYAYAQSAEAQSGKECLKSIGSLMLMR
jgi:hypothetical protein